MTSFRWANADNTLIVMTDDEGQEYWIPTDPANRHYAFVLEEGITPDPFVPPEEQPDAALQMGRRQAQPGDRQE
jgi:arylsulfatase A-like enzyme